MNHTPGATTAPPTRQWQSRQCTAGEIPRSGSSGRARYFDGICPKCGRDAVYARDLDRYLHLDGSENHSCWVAISRGEVLAFAREAEETWDDAVGRLRHPKGLAS
jgi:hypothetical protein